MASTLTPVVDITQGSTSQCELFQKIKEIIIFINDLQNCANQNDSDIGDMTLLLPNTNIADTLVALQAVTHAAAFTGIDNVVVVDPTTQEVTFDMAAFVTFLSDPSNAVNLTNLQALIDTDTYIDTITYGGAANPGIFTMTYNTGLMKTFDAGISTDAGNSLSYGTDGRVYYNILTLPVLP